MMTKNKNKLMKLIAVPVALLFGTAAYAEEKAACADHGDKEKCTSVKKLDRSGKARKGKASYYGREFYGKKMANGKPMNPKSNVAASKTLPLGTKAEVTNLETGKSAVVDIQDRGPYVKGRIVDLSPKVAEQLDIKEKGTAPVEVNPIAIPPEDKGLKAKAQ